MNTTVSCLAVLAVVCLTACSSGSKDRLDSTAGDCPAVGDLAVTFVKPFGSDGICQLSGTLTVNAVLRAGTDWRLDGTVQVGDSSSNPVLTVEAGATVRGDIDGSVVDYLYIFPGASLQSLGTAAAPVIFSSNDVDYELDPLTSGEWGGVVIEETALSQGSSRLEYTIVTEAGAAVTIGANDYAANLSLHGPHSSTKLHYVQSHASGSDGISFTAGDSNSNIARAGWILVTGTSRDGIYYKNFAGLLKDLLVIHGPGQFNTISELGGRSGIRAAGADVAPLIVNATLFGNDDDSVDGGIVGREFGIIFENFTNRARLANIAIVNFRNGCYEVGSNVDLGDLTLNDPPATNSANFVDGTHCINEKTLGDNLLGVVRADGMDAGVDIPNDPAGVDLLGFNDNGDGMQGYSSGGNAFFAGEVGIVGFTASWFLDSMAGLANGGAGLNRYNGGDTDDSG
ncbi:MAG: hypothetical protein WBN40_09420, partial [Pseudomonadales bacterium]